MTTPAHKSNRDGLNIGTAKVTTTEPHVSTWLSSTPELELAVESPPAAPVAGQNLVKVYEQLADFIYQTLNKTHGIALDKTPNTYRIITNLFLLAVEVRRRASSALPASAAAIVSIMLKIASDEDYRNQLITQSTERASVEFWTIDYPSLAGNASSQALTFVRQCLQTLLQQPQAKSSW